MPVRAIMSFKKEKKTESQKKEKEERKKETVRDSNRRPLDCKISFLPLEQILCF
jgi:hypothetical protein